MAIVKFISEKECHLFIDMEEVGVVQPNKMMKITLDSGSYLIEAKDANGNNIKRYELMVSHDDTQLLQNLASVNDDIDETIERLKNDSTIHFYHQRAVFCYNDKYGYINSQYKIAIEPIYSYAEDFINNKAIVKRIFPDGEKVTIIDIEGNICIGQWYDYIGNNENQILLKRDNTFYVLSRDNYAIVKEYKDAGYDNNAELIPVYQIKGVDDYYGYIDKTGTEIIPFIYDFAWNFDSNGFAKVSRFGHIHVVDCFGNLYFDLSGALMDGKPIPKEDSDSEGKEGVREEIYNAYKLSKEESVIKGFDYIMEFYPVKEGNEWGIGGYTYEGVETNEKGEYIKYRMVPTNRICSDRCDRILHYDNEYQIYRKDGICTLYANGKEYNYIADEIVLISKEIYSFEAQANIREINKLIIKKNKKYGIINLQEELILPIEYDSIIPTDVNEQDITGNIVITKKNGVCSLLRADDGEILWSNQYENIIPCVFNSDLYQIDSIFLVKEKGKYGCVGLYGNVILPTIYDAIEFKWGHTADGYHYALILHLSGKEGFFEYCEYNILNGPCKRMDFYIDPQFDGCISFDGGAKYGISEVFLKLNNKWGVVDKKYYLPIGGVYDTIDCSVCHCKPDLESIEFKYNTLEEARLSRL